MLEHLENRQEANYLVPELSTKMLATLAEVSVKLDAVHDIVLHSRDYFISKTVQDALDAKNRLIFHEVLRNEDLPNDPLLMRRAELGAKLNLEGIINYVSASALLLTHPFLENVVFDLLRLTRLCDIKTWLGKIDKKSIPVATLIEGGAEKVLEEKLTEYAKEREKDGLPKMVNFLASFVYPDEKKSSTDVFVFSYERLKEIDDLRHDFAHHRKKNYTTEQAKDDVQYLIQTGLYFLTLIVKRYALKAAYRPTS